jgi:hypothetical protein
MNMKLELVGCDKYTGYKYYGAFTNQDTKCTAGVLRFLHNMEIDFATNVLLLS